VDLILGPPMLADPEQSARRVGLPMPLRSAVGKVPVDCISMEAAVLLLVKAVLHGGQHGALTVVASNAWVVTLAERNAAFREAMRSADLVVPDGMSVVLASRWLGGRLPERVTGGDLMERLCAAGAAHGFRIFLLGGPPGAAVMAGANLTRRYPGLQLCGTWCPPPGFESDPDELERMRRTIREASPDILFVGLGAPRQEIWMQENRALLHAGVIVAVGAALERQAGLRRRAPRWMQRLALEWLFRLILEPRRLWRRYLLGNPRFLAIVLRQRFHRIPEHLIP
jgi:N-acetylglucosaminyldiphosphoundecaprenol N-acetyl-beta-D-mannosaminyltransferase